MTQNKNNKRLFLILLCGVIFMFGFAYMLVPIYNWVCKQTGLNGKSAIAPVTVSADMQVDYSRLIRVDFSTTIHGALKFTFLPLQQRVWVHPGETKPVYFLAENLTGQKITVQAVPSITPNDAARFLKKTECFCFTQQTFSKNEKAKMPVYFFIDPALGKDLKEVTLSYTLFDASDFVKNKTQNTQGRIPL